MLIMILKMAFVTSLYVALTTIIWLRVNGKKMSTGVKVAIGIFYGSLCILSTHFGVDYIHMMLNVRDLGPLIAGLFFDPLSGLISGFIGGIERYIAGTYLNVGSYTTVACSVSTCLAGIFAMFLSKHVFDGKRPKPFYAFFMGAVMEVFHMYAVLVTHSNDLSMAFYVVSACSAPMISFTAIGLCATSIVIHVISKEKDERKAYTKHSTISYKFQTQLFIVILAIMVLNIVASFLIQTGSAHQNAESTLQQSLSEIAQRYNSDERLSNSTAVGRTGYYIIFNHSGQIIKGTRYGDTLLNSEKEYINSKVGELRFNYNLFNEDFICRAARLNDGNTVLLMLPIEEVFWNRNVQAYETTFAAILLLTSVYTIVSMMVNKIVVKNINEINNSLYKITAGDLNEVVDVKSSIEFVDLSYGINETVKALKGYIAEAEKRMEKELELAATIQASSLPQNFIFPKHNEIELYALMDAAKEVGGDFYDFYFASTNKLALVIADVSGKGVPAALFMMKAKTAIRSFAQSLNSPKTILENVNKTLCEGNDAEMFVTVWMGIIELSTGNMICANAGHEFPIIYRNGNSYELIKEKHNLPLAVVEDLKVNEYGIKLNPGDKIFVYTDGVPEAINRADEQYGTDRLIKVLNDYQHMSSKDLLPTVRKDVEEFAEGIEQFDDITMLEFKLKGYNKV